jgi:arylsulfatase A-like enzyme
MLDGVKQKPLDGTSVVYTFDNATAPTRHGTQYFEMMGNRAIYKDGWMASTTPLRLPWINTGYEPNPDDFKWELYNINEDFSQADNLVGKNPEKLKELQDAFDVEAKKYNVYPLDSSMASRADPADPAEPHPRPLRVCLFPRHDPHPGRVRAGLQEQVVDDRRRDRHPAGRR